MEQQNKGSDQINNKPLASETELRHLEREGGGRSVGEERGPGEQGIIGGPVVKPDICRDSTSTPQSRHSGVNPLFLNKQYWGGK